MSGFRRTNPKRQRPKQFHFLSSFTRNATKFRRLQRAHIAHICTHSSPSRAKTPHSHTTYTHEHYTYTPLTSAHTTHARTHTRLTHTPLTYTRTRAQTHTQNTHTHTHIYTKATHPRETQLTRDTRAPSIHRSSPCTRNSSSATTTTRV